MYLDQFFWSSHIFFARITSIVLQYVFTKMAVLFLAVILVVLLLLAVLLLFLRLLAVLHLLLHHRDAGDTLREHR